MEKLVTVDLITGFLGAGKTTFIKKYLPYLKAKGENIRIIENEFGDDSIDTHMLKDEGCDIADLSGMCMCCVGKRAFIDMLIKASETGCDRILVEPSGIYDVDEFFEVMTLPDVAQRCEIGSIITIVDPSGIDDLGDESGYLLFSQILASGMIIYSKTQNMSVDEINDTKVRLDKLMANYGCDGGVMSEICDKSWENFGENDFYEVESAGYFRFIHDRQEFNHSEIFQSFEVCATFADEQMLKSKLEMTFSSPLSGKIYRIKGYVKDIRGNCYEVNSTPGSMNVRKVINNACINKLVIIGQKLKRNAIRDVFLL